MRKLKERFPLIGKTVDHMGEEYQVIGAVERRGRVVYIGRKFGGSLEYYLDAGALSVLEVEA